MSQLDAQLDARLATIAPGDIRCPTRGPLPSRPRGAPVLATERVDANFQANYRLSASFLSAHKGSFTGANRIWIGGYSAFGQDVTDYDALLTQQGIAHTTETPTAMAYRWGQRLGAPGPGRPRNRQPGPW